MNSPFNTRPTTSFDAIKTYVESRSPDDEALAAATEGAEEFGLLVPDALTGELLSFLAASAAGHAKTAGHTPTGIIMSSACSVLGVHLFRGFSEAGATQAHVTCIEPEVQFQKLAKSAFNASGIGPNQYRFLPSQPLDVVSRLANDSYDLAVAESAVEDIEATVEATLPAIRPGGTLVMLDTLLDGTVGDESRTDRQTMAARAADEHISELSGVTTTRLPLGAGMTIITKH